jgi:hypothetical protein
MMRPAERAIDYIERQALSAWEYAPGSVWRRCPVLASNGIDHWSEIDLAVFDAPIRRGVPEHCCIGVTRSTGRDIGATFRLLADSGAWVQFALREDDCYYRLDPESSPAGPCQIADLPGMLRRERIRFLPTLIAQQKRHRQGYLYERIFPITHRKLVDVFDAAVRNGWQELPQTQKRASDGFEQLCAAALRILCLQVFNHRGLLERRD